MNWNVATLVGGNVAASALFCYLYINGLQNKSLNPSGTTIGPRSSELIYMGEKLDFASDWWTSEKQVGLEFRALLSKEWLCATHKSRFQKPGDYQSLTIGKYPIMLVMGKDRQIRGFHDVCRHRAYKVTKKSAGSTLVFGCRYHGWSYDTTGALVRAPEFETVKAFRFEENGLMPVATRISPEGLVFVNFSASSTEPHLEHDALKKSISPGVILPEARFVKEFEADGAFNWKLSAEIKFGEAKGAIRGTTFSLFPLTSIFCSSADGYWISVAHEPVSSKKTHVRLDVYACDGKMEVPDSTLAAIEAQLRAYVQELEQSHAGLDSKRLQQHQLKQSTIGTREVLVPQMRANVAIDFQNLVQVRTNLLFEAEQVAKRQLLNVRSQGGVSQQGAEDDLFCKQVEQDCASMPCGRDAKALAW